MHERRAEQPDPADLHVPDGLAEALRRSDPGTGVRGEALAALDRRVLARARVELSSPSAGPRQRASSRGPWRWAAAAAVVLLSLGLWTVVTPPRQALAGDIDRNGSVNAIDSYRLALMLRAGNRLPGQGDFNGDGAIDGSDVRSILAHSVALRGGEPRGRNDAQQHEPLAELGTFRAVDIVIESPRPLGVYQVAVTPADAAVRIVGVEEGEKPFDAAPAYDPRALREGRIVLAAYPEALQPAGAGAGGAAGPVRVATLHLLAPDDWDGKLDATLVAAADAGGEPIDAARVNINIHAIEPEKIPAPTIPDDGDQP